MGTPAKAIVSIYVEKKEDIDKIFDWINKANKGGLDGDFDITVIDEGYDLIACEVYSDRCQNLDWQLERFSEFCKTIDSVIEFSCSVWVMSDGPYWSRRDE